MSERQIIETTENTITSYEVWIHRDEQGRIVWRREVIVTRDSKGRFVTWKPAELYRVAIGIIYVVHNHYYNFVLYYYHHDKKHIEDKIEDLIDLAKEELENHLGYREPEWWFEPVIKISDIEPVKFDADLIGVTETEIGEVPKKRK